MTGLRTLRLSPQQGFTLLEILLVLVIIAALAGLAVLARVDNQPRQLQQAGEKLAAQIALMSDQAVLEGREYGLNLKANSYQWLSYDNTLRQWQAVPAPAPEQLPAGLSLSLKLEGEPLSLGEADQDSATPSPQILLLSNGELSPFNLSLRGDRGAQRQLVSDGFNLPALSELEP